MERAVDSPSYFIVEASALPEVYRKVAETRRLLETGEEPTVSAATQRTGISRSAYYKYKDVVRPFRDALRGRIVTVQIILRDVPGVLSAVLGVYAEQGGNILTINQSIPINGCAAVSVGLETSGLRVPVERLLEILSDVDGVIRCQILAG